MIDESLIKATCGNAIFERGKQLYELGHVGSLDISDNGGLITIQSDVKSADTNRVYHVYIILSQNGEWILDNECTCPFYESNYSICKHAVAVLLKYINANDDLGVVPIDLTKPTDDSFKSLLDSYKPIISHLEEPQNISIIPRISSYNIAEGYLGIDFRIQDDMSHSYVIQNLDRFCLAIKNQSFETYGKYLAFTHSFDAFSETSQPLLQFLYHLYLEDDQYVISKQNTFNFYYANPNAMGRSLTLKGRYLDAFFQAVPIDTLTLQEDMIPFQLIKETYPFHATITKDEKGYRISSRPYILLQGHDYIYVLSLLEHIIYQMQMDAKTLPILQYFGANKNESFYIGESDLPAFSKYVFPNLTKCMFIDNQDGFDPLDYIPPKPNFKIYLDSPQRNRIDAELIAVYPQFEVNLLAKNSDDGTRDLEAEQHIQKKVGYWLNTIDHDTNRFILQDNEDKIYAFLKEGITYLQQEAEVFISDRLRKLSIKSAPKFSLSVSTSANNLLSLSIDSKELSLHELAEILNRYEKKKKFYRLKNGEFIEIDEAMDQLASLKETFSLNTADIENGEFEVPKYRALALNELSERTQFDLDLSDSFRHMIQNIEHIDQEQFEPNPQLNATLRPYQVDGFRWLSALKENGFGGLLADEMGLGKTIQVITFLASDPNRKRTLIVCPASLVYNWHNEIKRFMPSMHSVMVQGNANDRKTAIKNSKEDDILITSYDLLKRDEKYYEGITFTCQVIDEAQYIKNANTKAAKAVKNIQSSFRIALTGTPIENRLSELWSIFDYILPGFLHSYEYFKTYYELPITRDEDEFMQSELVHMISPFILRRLKKDVLKDLPEKLEEVYYAPLEAEQRELYDATAQHIRNMLNEKTDKEFNESKIQILAELTRLRQICCNPSLYYSNYTGNSAKEDLCIDTIIRAVESGHKVLLFSQFTSMLDILIKRLEEEKIKYYLLTGSTPKQQRAEMVEAFQHDDIPIFCISLKAGGTGLNLTAADIVIHYDPWWNTAVENQASDRAHRIGQENVVTVYKLIMKDTIEEKILKLQQDKSGLADRILSDDTISSSKLSREDLLSLL